MSIDKVKKLIEAIKTDPKAREQLRGVSEPRSEEEMIRLCAELAPKLGFVVTEDEIRAGVEAIKQERMKKTAADIQALSDEETETVAGGKEDLFWTGEDAPDGHEMGCFATYHNWRWSRDHDYWCTYDYYCYQHHHNRSYTCDTQTRGCEDNLRK